MGLSRLPVSLRLLLVTALCTSTTVAIPAIHLFDRADTCSSSQVSCPSTLPSNFCCDSGSKCIALAGNTTVVCCPSDSSCSKIRPVTCDVRAQDVSLQPNSTIKTTVFNVALEKCGDSTCCPFGYSCSNNSQCVMDSDQSEAPQAASTSASGTATATSATSVATSAAASGVTTGVVTSATSSASATAAPGTAADSSGDSSSKDSGPATTSIVGGVVGACLLLLIVAIIIFLYVRRKHKADSLKSEKNGGAYGHSRSISSTGSFGNIISEPIMQPNSFRTDFIRKTPSRDSSDCRSSTLVRSPLSTIRSPPSTIRSPPSTIRSPPSTIRIQPTPPQIRISIPNPFDSPNPSPNHQSIQPSPHDDEQPRHGTVRLPPIRAMKAQSHCSRRPGTPELQREPSSESINVFADPGTVKSTRPDSHPDTRPDTRATTFTDLMDEADLGEVRRGRPYVPGATPRI